MKLLIGILGKEITTQIVPIPEAVLKIPGRNSPAVNELIFEAEILSPLGYQSYFISENSDKKNLVKKTTFKKVRII